MHQSNGIAERAVRKVKDGGRCNLEQSGLRPSWWSYVCMHYCALHNDKGGAFALRFCEDVKWLRIPFGAMVDYMPTPDKRPAAFESQCRQGLFFGYHQHAGGKWSGDYYIADWDGLRQNPEAEPRQVRVHRIVEAIPVGRLDDLSFPLVEHRRRQRTVDFGPADPDAEEMFAPDEEDVPLDESGIGVLEGSPGDPLAGLDPQVDDTRGLGLYDEQGNVLIRRNVHSTRPPIIDPIAWRNASRHDRAKSGL